LLFSDKIFFGENFSRKMFGEHRKTLMKKKFERENFEKK